MLAHARVLTLDQLILSQITYHLRVLYIHKSGVATEITNSHIRLWSTLLGGRRVQGDGSEGSRSARKWWTGRRWSSANYRSRRGAKNIANANVRAALIDVRVVLQQEGRANSSTLSDRVACVSWLHNFSGRAVLPGYAKTDSLARLKIVTTGVDDALVDVGKLKAAK